MSYSPNKRWNIDTRIPLAVIITLILQLVGALVWATNLDAKVIHIEQQMLNQSNFNARFARLEERLSNVREDTVAMKHSLSRLTERLLQP